MRALRGPYTIYCIFPTYNTLTHQRDPKDGSPAALLLMRMRIVQWMAQVVYGESS